MMPDINPIEITYKFVEMGTPLRFAVVHRKNPRKLPNLQNAPTLGLKSLKFYSFKGWVVFVTNLWKKMRFARDLRWFMAV